MQDKLCTMVHENDFQKIFVSISTMTLQQKGRRHLALNCWSHNLQFDRIFRSIIDWSEKCFDFACWAQIIGHTLTTRTIESIHDFNFSFGDQNLRSKFNIFFVSYHNHQVGPFSDSIFVNKLLQKFDFKKDFVLGNSHC